MTKKQKQSSSNEHLQEIKTFCFFICYTQYRVITGETLSNSHFASVFYMFYSKKLTKM